MWGCNIKYPTNTLYKTRNENLDIKSLNLDIKNNYFFGSDHEIFNLISKFLEKYGRGALTKLWDLVRKFIEKYGV